jgi:uncharacterized protein
MPVALITGASSGFGFEFAQLFARDGYQLLLVAKPLDELMAAAQRLREQFPSVSLDIRAQDLSLSNAGQTLYDWVQAQGLKVDVLINNAGVGTYGYFNEIEPERDHTMFNLNMLTVYDLTRLFARDMIARDSGKILMVSSIAALQPSPLLAAYSATKAFVYQLAMGYGYELRRQKSKVRIMALCPPPARTPFVKVARMERTGLFDSFWTVTAAQVAREGYRALHRGKNMHIPGPVIGPLINLLNRIIPTRLKLWIVYDTMRER